jgi:hypothetical protein
MTWLPVELREATVWLHGEHTALELSIEQPPGIQLPPMQSWLSFKTNGSGVYSDWRPPHSRICGVPDGIRSSGS